MFAQNKVSCPVRQKISKPSRNFCVLVHCLARTVFESERFERFCGCNGEISIACHQLTRWSLSLKQGSYSVTVSTGRDEQVCICSSLWRQHCVTISKEYL